jgi:hypothetical protein
MMKDLSPRTTVRGCAVAAAIVLGVALGCGPATAGIDGTNSVVDHSKRTVQAISENTRISFVPPLDGSPFTREWFHDGRAAYHVSGPSASDWHGHITIGYMVGYPASIDGKLKFTYDTPGLELELTTPPALDFFDLLPRAGIEVDVGIGPGIKTVEAAGGDVSGTDGFIQMSGFHCTVTGVLGTTTIRPFVQVVSSDGDTVVAYGPISTI